MVVSSSELSTLRESHQRDSIAVRLGCFDILHAGHQAGIDFAKTHADILVVGIMPDEYVTRAKGPERPINSQISRLEAIDQAEGVDYSFLAKPRAISIARQLMSLRPDVYVEEEGYNTAQLKRAFLASIGTRYVVDCESRLYSTTQMISSLGLAEAITQSSLTHFS